jgi:G3E family GTPase
MSLSAIEAASRTPVTLLTGFLGSGKTTVLNHIVKQPEMAATAVIINEFGEVGIDHLLVEKATDDVVLMQSGCLCCTIRGDIADTLVNLFVDRAKGRIPSFERVVIETTGLADPAPILHALMQDPIVAERYMVDGVVTTVDAVNGMGTLDAQVEAVKQAAVADRLLLTKCDVVSAEARRELEARLAVLNPGAPIIEVTGGAVDPSMLFNLGLYDPGTKTIEVQRWLGDEILAAGEHGHHEHDDHHHADQHAHDINRHDAHIGSFCIVRDKPMSWTALSGWFDALTQMRGADLLRVKAIVAIDERPGQPVVLHGVQHLFHPPVLLPEWPSDDHRTRIVFITRDLLRETIEKSLAAFVEADEPPDLSPPPTS